MWWSTLQSGQSDSNQAPGDVSTIEPPPVMRFLVQNTALTVLQNGPEIEKMLMANNEGTADFSFLRSSDPFHGFYQHTLALYRSQNQPGPLELPQITTHQELDTLKLIGQLIGITGKERPSIRDQPPEPPKFTARISDMFGRNESDTINVVTAQFSDPSPFRLCKTITRNESDTIKLTPQLRDPPPSRLCKPITYKEFDTIKLTSHFVARYGKDFWLALIKIGDMDSQFEFMNPAHRRFDYFSQRAAACSKVLTHCEMLKNDTTYAATVLDAFFTCLRGERFVDTPMIDLNAGIDYYAYVENQESPPQLSSPLGLEGMTPKEFDTLKVMAQFVARYGMDFWLALTKSRKVDSQFEFMNSGASGFNCFNMLVAAYSKVLRPSENLRDGTARASTLVDGFFHRLGGFERMQEHSEGMDMAVVNLHAFVCSVDCFANLDNADFCPCMPRPEYLSEMMTERLSGMLGQSSMEMMQEPPMPDEEPEPKRQKPDKLALVPEDQYLAQHPGSCTIRVSVPNVNAAGQVIEITVQSLSENVACLKEKIAGEIQIPANKQKLSGKTGFLKDNMSLAQYNAGAGDILALSL